MIQFSLQKKLQGVTGEMTLDVSGVLQDGLMVGLSGPSGAGKTSLLRMISGLMRPDSGQIIMDTVPWYDGLTNINVAPAKRNVGFVFQDYALFPNMNVEQHIVFAMGKAASKQSIGTLLELTGLAGLAYRRINTLSGGQQQRVALARSIARKPRLLLLDEPLSAIDEPARLQLQEVLRQTQAQYHFTTILVSHNPDDLLGLTQKIISIAEGRLLGFFDTVEFFLKQKPGSSKIRGKIISIDRGEGNRMLLHIQMGDLLTITCESKQAEGISTGDQIQVDYNGTIPVIHKLLP